MRSRSRTPLLLLILLVLPLVAAVPAPPPDDATARRLDQAVRRELVHAGELIDALSQVRSAQPARSAASAPATMERAATAELQRLWHRLRIERGRPPARRNDHSGLARLHVAARDLRQRIGNRVQALDATATGTPPPTLGTGGEGSISGTVTAAADGGPIVGAYVYIYDAGGFYVTYGYTDSDGAYVSTAGLAPGSYLAVTSNFAGYVDELWDGIPCPGFDCSIPDGTPIDVIADADTGGIDFALDTGGSLSGQITEEAGGEPLSSLYVEIYDADGDYVTYGYTDASGDYRSVSGLTSGDYFVVTDSDDSYIDELWDDLRCAFGRCEVTEGTPVPVVIGSDTGGIDFALALGGSISGTVTDGADGAPLRDVQVEIYADDGTYLTYDYTDASGNYTSRGGLSTGDYFARSDNDDGYVDELWDDIPCPGFTCYPPDGTPIAVTEGADVPGVDFALEEGGSISGTVTDLAGGAPLEDVYVDIYDASGNYVTYDSTDASGDYTSRAGLTGGDYFALTYNGDGWVDELWDDIPCPGGNCDLFDGTPIAVAPGSDTPGVDFALEEGGSISGTVTASDTGDPVANAYAYAYDADGDYLTSGRTDASGNYTTSTGLASGDYFVLTYNTSGLLDELWDDILCPGFDCRPRGGSPVPVDAGLDTPGIDFALDPGSRIGGRVTDETSGDPIVDSLVNVYDWYGRYVTYDYTDGDGEYLSTSAFPSGTYFVLDVDAPGYVEELWDDIPCDGCSVLDGDPVGLAPGVIRDDVDFALAPAVRPENDDCTDALPVSPGLVTGSTSEATNDGSASCAASDGSPDVWYLYTAGDELTLTVSTCDEASNYDTALSIHSGCPGEVGNELACDDDSSCPLGALLSEVSVELAAGESVWIRVTGFSGATGEFGLVVTESEHGFRIGAEGTCPGEVAITIEEGTPGGGVLVAGGSELGDAVVPGGDCAGTELGLSQPDPLARASLDADGSLSRTLSVPDVLCGTYLQAVDLTTCAPTPVEGLPESALKRAGGR